MITNVQQLLTEITDHDATELPLEVYTTTGKRFLVIEAYVEDGKFCLDIHAPTTVTGSWTEALEEVRKEDKP